MSSPGGDSDGPARTSVRVRIVGEEYTIRSDAPEAHTRAVAAYVDRVIEQVLVTGAVVDTRKAAILAALQIADELLRARAADVETAERMRALGEEIARWLPPAKRADVTP